MPASAHRKGCERPRDFSLATPRLNPCAGGASIRPPPAHAGKSIREERHGQGSDAQQQGKEEAEGGVEQEEKRRPRPLAVRFGTGAAPAGPESLRQEELTEPPSDGAARGALAPRARMSFALPRARGRPPQRSEGYQHYLDYPTSREITTLY